MKKPKKNYLNIFASLLGDSKNKVIVICILGVIGALIELGNSIFAAYFGINKALLSKDFSLIVVFVCVSCALSLTAVLIFHIGYRMSLKLVQSIGKSLRKRVYKKAIDFDADYFTSHSTGAMINTIIYDVETFSEGMAYNIQTIFKMITKVSISFIVITIINPRLSIILWLIAPILGVFAYFIFRYIGKLYDKRRTITKNRLSYINEGIVGVKTIKSLNLEEHEKETFKKYNNQNFNIQMKLALINDFFWRFFDICTYTALAILFVKSYSLSISYGELYLYYQLFKNTLYVIGHLAGEFDYFSEIVVSTNKIYDLLNYNQLVKDKPYIVDIEGNLNGNIKYENVCFKYPKGESVLENFNLEIPAHKKYAIVGKTGSGKSTIANLLFRFYEPNSGTIYLDGVDYTNMSLNYIHSQIGFILQETMLFDDTIYENVRYAKSDATDEEIEQVCKSVGADEFINSLSDGYNTKIGESGILLSNGQKQLLAFARVVLKNPPIIILDEATSHIDSYTEELIQKNISNILANKTCLFIAHRLSTIVNADKILYLEDGNIIEQGTHVQLMTLNGEYAKLYNNQFEKNKLEEYLLN